MANNATHRTPTSYYAPSLRFPWRVAKESSAVEDYTHALRGIEELEGVKVYRVESTPKPEAAVVWGKIVYKIR